MERLNGISYYQQTRKCNKDGCHCEHNLEHGPYWYARDGSGKIRYIGKDLPDDIQAGLTMRRDNRGALRARMDSNFLTIDGLKAENRAILDYLQGLFLNDRQIRLIGAATGISLRLV